MTKEFVDECFELLQGDEQVFEIGGWKEKDIWHFELR